MKYDEAAALVETLNARMTQKHGVGITFKVTHPERSSRTTDYSVSTVNIVTRKNLMTGKEFQEDEDTPPYLSPAYETYWTM